jgi:hypothetical protein
MGYLRGERGEIAQRGEGNILETPLLIAARVSIVKTNDLRFILSLFSFKCLYAFYKV